MTLGPERNGQRAATATLLLLVSLAGCLNATPEPACGSPADTSGVLIEIGGLALAEEKNGRVRPVHNVAMTEGSAPIGGWIYPRCEMADPVYVWHIKSGDGFVNRTIEGQLISYNETMLGSYYAEVDLYDGQRFVKSSDIRPGAAGFVITVPGTPPYTVEPGIDDVVWTFPMTCCPNYVGAVGFAGFDGGLVPLGDNIVLRDASGTHVASGSGSLSYDAVEETPGGWENWTYGNWTLTLVRQNSHPGWLLGGSMGISVQYPLLE